MTIKPEYKNQRGFTLIEILIVVAIIGILSSIIFVSINHAQSKSNYTRVLADMKQASSAIQSYTSVNNNIYPADVTLNVMPAGVSSYLPGGWPTSPCGATYTYDYQNWDVSICNSCPLCANGLVTITYRGTGDNLFYLDLVDFGASCTTRGTSIINKSPKEITCNE